MPPRTERQLPGIRESITRLGLTAALLRPYWSSYVRLFIIGVVLAAVGLIAPFFTKVLVDRVYPSSDVNLLGLIVLAMLTHSLVTSAVGGARTYYGGVIGAHLQADTTVFLVNHLLHLPLRFFERLPVGDLLARFNDLRRALRSVTGLFDVLLQGVYLLLIPPILLVLNWRLALLAFVTVPLTTGMSVAVARALRRRWKLVAEANAEVQALNVETLSHVRLLKGMGLERLTFDRTVTHAADARDQVVGVTRLSVMLATTTSIIRIAGDAIFTWVAWLMILDGTFSLGAFLAFTAYLGLIRGPLHRVTSLVSQFQQTAVVLDRIFEVLDEGTEADPTRMYDPEFHPAPLTVRRGVRLRGVRFSYGENLFSLDLPDLHLPAGTITGVIGESGSGKSTLLRLVAGLESPLEGVIFYDASAHTSLDIASIRRSVAVAWQAPEILRGSLRSNIITGSAGPGWERRLEEIVDVCQLRDLVATLPHGLDTPVSEWGATLSGGQQQRLSLARALMRDTSIILLDEITSNLDDATEASILDGLESFLSGQTVVLVSHRRSTIRRADRVVTLSGGRAGIVEDLPSRYASGDPGLG